MSTKLTHDTQQQGGDADTQQAQSILQPSDDNQIVATQRKPTLGGITGKGFLPGKSGNPAGPKPLFHIARDIAQRILNEPSKREEHMTKLEAIFHDWAESRTFEKQLALVQHGYGKVPNAPIELPANLNVKGYTVIANPDQWDQEGAVIAVHVETEPTGTEEQVIDADAHDVGAEAEQAGADDAT